MVKRRLMGGIAVALLVATSLACGTSGTDSSAETGTYLRGPFTTAPTGTETPPVANPLPAATSPFYLTWSHTNLPANEQVTATLIAVDVGTSAAPGSTITTAQFTGSATGGPQHGPVDFSLPRPWPVGSYRVTVTGNTVGTFGTVEFRVQ